MTTTTFAVRCVQASIRLLDGCEFSFCICRVIAAPFAVIATASNRGLVSTKEPKINTEGDDNNVNLYLYIYVCICVCVCIPLYYYIWFHFICMFVYLLCKHCRHFLIEIKGKRVGLLLQHRYSNGIEKKIWKAFIEL